MSCSFVMPRRGCFGWGEIRGGREEEGAMVRFCTAANNLARSQLTWGQLMRVTPKGLMWRWQGDLGRGVAGGNEQEHSLVHGPRFTRLTQRRLPPTLLEGLEQGQLKYKPKWHSQFCKVSIKYVFRLPAEQASFMELPLRQNSAPCINNKCVNK